MTHAKNQVALAEILGVTRQTVHAWLRIPGNPGKKPDGRYPIEPWKAWATEHGRKAPKGSELLTRKERLEEIKIKREEHKYRVERRQHVPVKDVEAIGARLASSIRKVVTTLHRIAPDLEGLGKAEIEMHLRAKEDEIIAQLFALDEDVKDLQEAVVIEDEEE